MAALLFGVFFLLSLPHYSNSAPHKSVHEIVETLRAQNLPGITSKDGFKCSLHCVACGVSLSVETDKAIWALSRHSQQESHKTKAAWFIDKDRNVVKYKPKGECV